MRHVDKVDARVREYYAVLEPKFPDWLDDYIETPELQKQRYISMTCGLFYTKMLNTSDLFYSSLDHSVAVALIVWHFTHDKKQTLAGLFHDIATPCFKHCIDFLDGDYLSQESTEGLTSKIIANSRELMRLLRRDKIKLAEVDNYHDYPIADNETPKLSADRLEYSFSNGLFLYNKASILEVKRFYENLKVRKNEEGVDELSFRTREVARDFVKLTTGLSLIYMGDETRYSMQFLADVIRKLGEAKMLCRADLYELKETEVIERIEQSDYREVYEKWRDATELKKATVRPVDAYAVNIDVKKRYIDPLTEEGRMSEICEAAKEEIMSVLDYDMNRYLYLDFDLE